MATSRRAHTIPSGLCHQYPCPHTESQLTPASPGDSLRPAGRPGPGSCGVSHWFALGSSACKILCASFKSGVSVFLSPVQLLHSSPIGLQSQMFWGLFLPMPEPQAGGQTWGSELRPVVEPLQYNYFPVHGLPTWWVWALIISWECFSLQFHCDFVFGCRISFSAGFSLFCQWLFSSKLWFWCFCERKCA